MYFLHLFSFGLNAPLLWCQFGLVRKEKKKERLKSQQQQQPPLWGQHDTSCRTLGEWSDEGFREGWKLRLRLWRNETITLKEAQQGANSTEEQRQGSWTDCYKKMRRSTLKTSAHFLIKALKMPTLFFFFGRVPGHEASSGWNAVSK